MVAIAATRAGPQFVPVLPVAALPAAEGLSTVLRRVEVEGRQVLVGRRADGRVVAFAPTCPHEGTDLGEATFWDGHVRCPRHNYLYDPVTGENVVPSRIARPEHLAKLHPGSLPTFPTDEHDGWIRVADSETSAPAVPPPPPPVDAAPRAGAGPPRPDPDAPVDRPPTRVRVQAGARFALRLPTRLSPGCVWRVDADPPVVEVVNQAFEPGDPPRQRVELVARAAGTAVLTCRYGHPWEEAHQERRTYVVEVMAPG